MKNEMQPEIDEWDVGFKQQIEKIGFFKPNKSYVFDNTYVPSKILHRDNERRDIIAGLGGVGRGEKPYDLLVYGRSGTGKTMMINIAMEKLKNSLGNKFHYFMFNCRQGGSAGLSTYKILTKLLKDEYREVYGKGHGTDDLMDIFFDKLKKIEGHVVIVFDEIDSFLEKNGDGFIYDISRINEIVKDIKCSCSIVGISNVLNLKSQFDTRVVNVLRIMEINFGSYNAIQLNDILRQRAEKGLLEDVYDEEIISMVGAYGAREHGDVRRSLDIFSRSITVAEKLGLNKLTPEVMQEANDVVSATRLFDIIAQTPKSFQIVAYAAMKKNFKQKHNLITSKKSIVREPITMGELVDEYGKICKTIGVKEVGYDSIYGYVQDLCKMKVLSSQIVSKGRYGRSSYIKVTYGEKLAFQVIDRLKELLNLI